MGLDFRGIRKRLQLQLDRLQDRAIEIKIALIRRGIDALEDKTAAAALSSELGELEARNNGAARKSMHERALFTAVGQALSIWAHMEGSLVVITGMLLRTKFTKAGIVMYSIVNFNSWLGVIDELFSVDVYYNALKPKWNKVNKKLRGPEGHPRSAGSSHGTRRPPSLNRTWLLLTET